MQATHKQHRKSIGHVDVRTVFSLSVTLAARPVGIGLYVNNTVSL